MTRRPARVKLTNCDFQPPAKHPENLTVISPAASTRIDRPATLIAALVCAILASAPSRSHAQAVKQEPTATKQQPKAKQKAKAAPSYAVPPTFSNVAYGTHERQVLDFFKADTAGPAPLVVNIHGGGWVAGDKVGVGDLKKFLDNGISVASINYRYTTLAQAAGIKPPVKWPLEDAARAIQFLRSKAGEWNIDKKRIAATGGSAGACSSLWLAFHDDMAKPDSTDPVARESTRLFAVAVNGRRPRSIPCSFASGCPTCDTAATPSDSRADAAQAATHSSSSSSTTAPTCSTGSRSIRPIPTSVQVTRRSS